MSSTSPAGPATYRPLQDGLRATGRYLDKYNRRLVSLMVIADGIVVAVRPHDPRSIDEAVLLTHDDLHVLWQEARAGRGRPGDWVSPDPLCPTGYEDFLRAMGDAVARRGWTALRLVRIGDEVILRFGSARERRELVLGAQDVQGLLNRAFMQRGRGPAS